VRNDRVTAATKGARKDDVQRAVGGVGLIVLHLSTVDRLTSLEGANLTQEQDLDALARSIVDANRFMALGTADASGTPWVSPVWYAPLSYREYVWVSCPGTRHSRNLAERPQVAIVIYDSHRPGTWSAFYMAAVAQELEDVDDALEAFNRRSEAQGLRAWSRDEVVPAAEFRLYRATATEQFVLDDHDAQLPVQLQ
jgi:nitroimidazol reductase NimA-like FMN-containing flavoprotein (pyridoxamine 5'-phosphate oxidase superfamily)